MQPKYIVRAVNDDDVVLRPLVVRLDEQGQEIAEDKIGGWCLNDWERAQRFANEMNEL